MNPEIARTLTEQRRGELTRYAAGSRRGSSARPGWVRRHLPRWHVSWSRTVLSPSASLGAATGGFPDRRGSSVVIIISAHR
jgi:hypothetical protein